MDELEKTLASGDTCTLTRDGAKWVVDMWKPSGDNHWNRYYDTYEKAKAEYDKW